MILAHVGIPRLRFCSEFRSPEHSRLIRRSDERALNILDLFLRLGHELLGSRHPLLAIKPLLKVRDLLLGLHLVPIGRIVQPTLELRDCGRGGAILSRLRLVIGELLLAEIELALSQRIAPGLLLVPPHGLGDRLSIERGLARVLSLLPLRLLLGVEERADRPGDSADDVACRVVLLKNRH